VDQIRSRGFGTVPDTDQDGMDPELFEALAGTHRPPGNGSVDNRGC
jgi:hypothetical protein